jgi:hypothetical protein
VPVLACFVGAAAATPTKHARTGICWVTLAYTSVRRKVSAVCQDYYWNQWAKDMHIKGEMKSMTPHGITGLERVKTKNIQFIMCGKKQSALS